MKAFTACALGALLALASALVCAQTSLGPGWEKAAGPYRNSHCEKLIIAK
jgi:hypothetical protein